jgi:replicative superfamily II helicase
MSVALFMFATNVSAEKKNAEKQSILEAFKVKDKLPDWIKEFKEGNLFTNDLQKAKGAKGGEITVKYLKEIL